MINNGEFVLTLLLLLLFAAPRLVVGAVYKHLDEKMKVGSCQPTLPPSVTVPVETCWVIMF